MSGITENGIRYPDSSTKAKDLGVEFKRMAEDIDAFIKEQGIGYFRGVIEPGTSFESLATGLYYVPGSATAATLGLPNETAGVLSITLQGTVGEAIFRVQNPSTNTETWVRRRQGSNWLPWWLEPRLDLDRSRAFTASLPIAWQQNTPPGLYTASYTADYPGGTTAPTNHTGRIPLLNNSQQLPLEVLPSELATTDGSKPFDLIRIGQSVQLKEVQGARGHRLQYTSANPGDENARPYMEVNASSADVNGDVIAGYQSHVTGDGTTPNTGERVYWFLEAHGLQHAANANPDFEGWYSMGVSNRAELTPRGRGRAFILDAGNRPGIAFHFYKPYAELQPNTAFTLDDRARPAFGDGKAPHHNARSAGTLHGGDYLNFRREGTIGARFTTVHDSPATAPAIFQGRSRGTVAAPENVQAGDRLAALQAGTQTDISPDYVHVPGNGTDPRNRKHVSAQILAFATENYTPGTAQGSAYDLQTTPAGTATQIGRASCRERV